MTKDITSPDGEPIAIDWDARLRSAVQATLNARARKRDLRADLNERRNAGLAARHRNKLNHTRSTTMTRDDIAQQAAEYIASELMPRQAELAGEGRIVFPDNRRPPTDVPGIKAELLAGYWWVSWVNERVAAAMKAIHRS